MCRAFGGRLGLSVALLSLAALPPRSGASLGGLPPTLSLLGHPRSWVVPTPGDQVVYMGDYAWYSLACIIHEGE
jgi:hypothetical protein